jgi:hypothetical protein
MRSAFIAFVASRIHLPISESEALFTSPAFLMTCAYKTAQPKYWGESGGLILLRTLHVNTKLIVFSSFVFLALTVDCHRNAVNAVLIVMLFLSI